MILNNYITITFCAVAVCFVSSTIDVKRAGWLDRVVQWRKNKFFQDVEKLPPVQIRATIAKAPPGYVDSADWTYESVIRLLTLIRDSEHTKPVARALRRALSSSSRRVYWTRNLSDIVFKNHDPNNFYDAEYEYNDYELLHLSSGPISDDSIVIVSNPVEARLPNAHISVRELKNILDNRAKEARIMPTTTPSTIRWIPMNKTTKAAGNETGGGAANVSNANVTSPAGAASSDGAKGNGTGGGDTANNTDAGATTEPATVAAAARRELRQKVSAMKDQVPDEKLTFLKLMARKENRKKRREARRRRKILARRNRQQAKRNGKKDKY